MIASEQAKPTQQPLGYTQRIKKALTPGWAKQPVASDAKAVAAQQKLDPISLGFASDPPNAKLYLSMAQLSDQGGNVDHARGMYQKVLAMESDNLEALLGLARLEDREGRLDEALKIYRQAVNTHPQNTRALNDLALCHARQEQLSESLHFLEQAIRIQPDKQLYRNNIAKVSIELNRLDEAVAHLAAVYPPAIAQFNMGVLLQQRGRSDEAAHFLTAATRADPQLQVAQTLLTQITAKPTQLARREIPSTRTASNDDILPTPLAAPSDTGLPYPRTGALAPVPVARVVPTETARTPVGNAPILLPPVRSTP